MNTDENTVLNASLQTIGFEPGNIICVYLCNPWQCILAERSEALKHKGTGNSCGPVCVAQTSICKIQIFL